MDTRERIRARDTKFRYSRIRSEITRKKKKKVLNNTLSIIPTMTETQLRQLRDEINTPVTEV